MSVRSDILCVTGGQCKLPSSNYKNTQRQPDSETAKPPNISPLYTLNNFFLYATVEFLPKYYFSGKFPKKFPRRWNSLAMAQNPMFFFFYHYPNKNFENFSVAYVLPEDIFRVEGSKLILWIPSKKTKKKLLSIPFCSFL